MCCDIEDALMKARVIPAEYDKVYHNPSEGKHEVTTDFGGMRLRSSYEIVEEGPGRVSFRIEGPSFEFDDELEDE